MHDVNSSRIGLSVSVGKSKTWHLIMFILNIVASNVKRTRNTGENNLARFRFFQVV